MQFDAPALAAPPRTIERPTHARQRSPQGPVVSHPAPPLEPGIGRSGPVDLRRQIQEDSLQQFRVQQVLRFGKTAQAHRTRANVLPYPLEMAGRAEGAHRSHDRVEQAEEVQAQVIGVEQPPFGDRSRKDGRP